MLMKLRFFFKFLLISLLTGSCSFDKKNTDAFDVDKAINYCVEKTLNTIDGLDSFDRMPRNILKGQKEWNTVGIHDWTSGFWPGILWYAYEASGDSIILNNAKKFTASLKGVLDVPVDNHDLGFMLFNSYGNGYRLTEDEVYREFVLSAADSLATLYKPKVGTILSWPSMVKKMDWPHNTIIDNMINLELLFWASKNGGSKKLYEIAVNHASVSMKTLIRGDYTTYHVAVFDTVDGHFIKGVTHQGYADNSMWARGQAWGIYGFTMCYRETGRPEFLETAKRLADVFIERLPEDKIPYWDFDDPAIPNSPKDASAAAVAASAMLELSEYIRNELEKAKLKNNAVSILGNLSSEAYLSGNQNKAFLMHSTGHKPKNSEVDASIIYADYYYLEALLRLKKMKERN